MGDVKLPGNMGDGDFILRYLFVCGVELSRWAGIRNYERMGRDMELNGDIFTIKTGYQEVHIFWNC